MLKQPGDLKRQVARDRKRRQSVRREKPNLRCFATRFRFPADDLAQEEHFVDMKWQRRLVRMFCAIINRGQLRCFRSKSGFLPDLALHGLTRRIVHVRPATGHRPQSIRRFAHKQDFPIPKRGSPNIDFRCRVTFLFSEHLLKCRYRSIAMQGHQLGCDLRNKFVSVPIILVRIKSKASLRRCLKLARERP